MNARTLFTIITTFVYVIASLAMLSVSILMIGYAMWEVWIAATSGVDFVKTLLDAIGLVVIAMAVFDLFKYLMEEEVLRDRELRSPREARQTLTKFLVIIIIAVTLEALVFVFGAGTTDMRILVYPTLLLATSVFMVIGLGIYQRMSIQTEQRKRTENGIDDS